MTQLIVTDEQAQLLATAAGPVRICSASGKTLGYFEPEGPENEREVAEVQARLGRPHERFTTAEVLDRLQNGQAR